MVFVAAIARAENIFPRLRVGSKKNLTLRTGYGLILGTKSRIEKLSEEHGVIRIEEGDRFEVGQRVRILPITPA